MTLPTPGPLTLHERTQRIKDQALAVGFDLVGVAPVQESPELAFFERWLDAGYAGEMHYLNLPTTYCPTAIAEQAHKGNLDRQIKHPYQVGQKHE